jgi:hypothetical protein
VEPTSRPRASSILRLTAASGDTAREGILTTPETGGLVTSGQMSVIRRPACALYRRFTETRFAVSASTWPQLRSRPA